MGNELAQFQNRMTAENWDFLLKMLIKTTEHLLVKKRIDSLLKGAKFVRHPEVDVFNPPAGPGHNIIGRIRPADRKATNLKTRKSPTKNRTTPVSSTTNSNMAFNFGTGKAIRGLVPLSVYENIPEAWTEEAIKITQENLIKLETESKLKPPSNEPLDKKTEIRPPKPEEGLEPWTALHDWTVFGFLPSLNLREKKMAIDKLTSEIDSERIKINDRTILFKGNNLFIGQILPDLKSDQSVLKKMEEDEANDKLPTTTEVGNPEAIPPEIETPQSTQPEGENATLPPLKTEGERETDDSKKKRKRKYKKRAPKT